MHRRFGTAREVSRAFRCWAFVGAACLLGSSSGVATARADDARQKAEAEEERSKARSKDARDHAWDWGDDLSGFGEKGKLALSSDAAFSVQQRVQSDGKDRGISVVIAPSLDYFVVKNWSIGGLLSYTFTKSGDTKSQRTIIGPRVGYNVELTGLFSLWPRIGFSYANSRNVLDELAASRHALALNVSLPLMIHYVSNFFIGFGPYFDTDLTGSPRVTAFGGKLTMGGSPFEKPER